MYLSDQLKYLLGKTLKALEYPEIPVVLEVPPNAAMGDRSCTVALNLAKDLRKSPREIAEKIAEKMPRNESLLDRIEVAGAGYLNFFWSHRALLNLLKNILIEQSGFGSSEQGAGEKRQFEFVSANPTGPMNVVSARAAAVGNSLVRLHKKIGYKVQSEFYVNDAGRQVQLLGESVRVRAMEFQGQGTAIPEGGYHGEYIKDYARMVLEEYSGDLESSSAEDLGRWTAHLIVEDQRKTLLDYGVHFDEWFFESNLHTEGRTQQALHRLQEGGYIFEKDGALYFRSTDFGDEEDRVVMTSDGRPTYFLPDIAYHLNKAERGFIKVFDLWGPDHHGHVTRMQAAMRALGLPEGFLEVIIVQQVNLLRGGEPVKMSKRTGEMITMDELLEEVGADAAKQIFLSRRWSSHLDFDIEVAKDRSEKSPVFYVQYAHARVCSIFRKAGEYDRAGDTDLQLLTAPEERDLLRHLSLFPDVVETAAIQLAPQRLNTYLSDLATIFHRFYHERRVLSDEVELTRARLTLCRAVHIVLKEGLRLLGMSAPEKM